MEFKDNIINNLVRLVVDSAVDNTQFESNLIISLQQI